MQEQQELFNDKAEFEKAKAEFEKAVDFANKIMKDQQNLYNPKKSNNRPLTSFSAYTKKDLIDWLKSPSNNEKNLRNASQYLYSVSQQYKKLINYYPTMLLWKYIIAPKDFNNKNVKNENKTDKLYNQYVKLLKTVDNMNIQHEFTKALIVALRDGVFFGVCRTSDNAFFIQQLDADICRVSSIIEGTWNFSIDMSKIKEEELAEDVNLYPTFFKDMYKAYRNSGERLQEVPIEYSFCIKADEVNLTYSIPYWAGIMPMLYDIENYKALQETASELGNYKVLGFEIPLKDDGTPKVDWKLAKKYYNHICNALPQYVGAYIAPFKGQDFSFQQSASVSDIDIVSRATEQYWQEVGSPSVIHGAAAETSGALKLAIHSDEAEAFMFLNQIERLINRYLNNLSGKTQFKLEFLPLTIFNKESQVKLYKESATLGLGKLAYAISIDIKQQDIEGLCFIEDNFVNMDKLTPLISSYNSGEAGRNSVDEVDLDDEGLKTRDNDSNNNR